MEQKKEDIFDRLMHLPGLRIFEKFYKKNKNKAWYKVCSWFITINLVIFGLYIFSGEPYKMLMTLLNK